MTIEALTASFLVRVDRTIHQSAKAFRSKSALLSSLTNWLDKIWVCVPTKQLLVAFVSLWNHLGASILTPLTHLLRPALCHGSGQGCGHILHLKAAKEYNSQQPMESARVCPAVASGPLWWHQATQPPPHPISAQRDQGREGPSPCQCSWFFFPQIIPRYSGKSSLKAGLVSTRREFSSRCCRENAELMSSCSWGYTPSRTALCHPEKQATN